MVELMNWHTAAVVVTDKHSERHTIPAQGTAKVDGDFSEHPYVKSGLLSLDGEVVATEDKKSELEQLRLRFKSIFGKAPPPAAKAETLLARIEEWQNQQDD